MDGKVLVVGVEQVVVDFRLRPEVWWPGEVGVDEISVPFDSASRILVLVYATQGMPEFVQDDSPDLVGGGLRHEPSIVHGGLGAGALAAVSADVRPGAGLLE